MTNVQPVRAERMRTRTNELLMRLKVPQHIDGRFVVQVGRFYPGGVGMYAVFAMITVQLLPNGDTDLATHMAAFADDRPEPEWYLYSGRYDFSSLGQAQADLATR